MIHHLSKNNKDTSLVKEQQKYITCQRTTKIHHLSKNNKNTSLVKEQQKYITCQRTTMTILSCTDAHGKLV